MRLPIKILYWYLPWWLFLVVAQSFHMVSPHTATDKKLNEMMSYIMLQLTLEVTV